jgi:hypothetical protein
VAENLKEDTGLASVGAIRFFTDGTTKEEYPYKKMFFDEGFRIRYTSIIIRKTVFDGINGFDTGLKSSHFTDLCIRAFHYIRESQLKIISIDECLIKVNIHEGPRIRTNWSMVREGSIQFINKHYQFLKHSNNSEHISNIYSVIAFSNYKLKNRQQSLHYLLKAIQHNPLKVKNYLKVFKYAIA